MSIINNKMKNEVAEKLTENFQKELYKLQVSLKFVKTLSGLN